MIRSNVTQSEPSNCEFNESADWPSLRCKSPEEEEEEAAADARCAAVVNLLMEDALFTQQTKGAAVLLVQRLPSAPSFRSDPSSLIL